MPKNIKLNFIMCYISIVGYMGATIYIGFLPELGQVFHVSHGPIKFSITIYFIGLTLGTALSGPLSEIYRRLDVLRFFLALSVIATLICGLAPSIYWFLGGRLLQGIGFAVGPILVMAFIDDHYKGSLYDKLMSYILIMISLGPGISPIIGVFLFHFFEWRVVFYVLSFLNVLTFGLTFYMQDNPQIKRGEAKNIMMGFRFLFMQPLFRYYCLMIGTLYGAFYAFITVSPYIFRLHYKWNPIDFIWVGLALAFASSFGSYIYGRLSNEIKFQTIFKIGIFILIISFFLFFIIELPFDGVFFLLMMICFIIGDNIISSCLTTESLNIGSQFSNISASFVSISKVFLSSAALIFISFLPETLIVINSFIIETILVCIIGYLITRASSNGSVASVENKLKSGKSDFQNPLK